MQPDRECKNGILNKLLYCVFAIYIVTLFANSAAIYLEYDYVQKAIKIIRYGCYLIFAIKTVYLFIQEKNITRLNFLFFIIGVLILILGKNPEFLIVFFIINASRDLDFKKIAIIGLVIYAALFVITVISSYFGIVPNWMFYRQEIKRYSLGFIYPTDLMSVYVTITLLYFYIRNTKSTYLELFILEAIAIALYKYTNGRLGLIMTTMIILFLMIGKIFKHTKLSDKIKINSSKIKNIVIILLKLLPILLFIVILAMSILYQNDIKIINWVNHIISERILLNSQAISNYPVKLFGSNVTWNGLGGKYNVSFQDIDYNYVDMSYIRIIFDYGIIGTLFILYLYVKSIGHLAEKNDKLMLECVLIILIWSAIEPVIFSIARNLFIIYIGSIIANIENKDNELLLKNTRRDV